MKKFLSSAAAIALAAVSAVSFAACKPTAKNSLLAEPAESTTLPYTELYEDEFVSFKNKVNNFAYKFTPEANTNSNYAVSPISVYMALSLAAECSAGNTQSQILNALGVDYETLSTNISKLYRQLDVEHTTYDGQLTGMLELSNSIWINEGTRYNQKCVDALAEKYFAYSYQAPFALENKAANEAIRQFVKDKTHGLIDQDFSIPSYTLFTLINTLYLKDIWSAFGDDLRFTENEIPFKNTDGSTVNKKLLQGYYESGRAYRAEKFTSFYAATNSYYKLKFIIPNDGYTLNEVFTAENIAEANSVKGYDAYDKENLLHYNTHCIFPEFETEFDDFIDGILKAKFGVTDFFNENCNMSPLTKNSIYCSGIKHVAKLKVDKTGIEGAAVTVEMLAGSTAPVYKEVYEELIIDRGFGFVLTDSDDVVLFSGTVNNIK